MPRSNRHPFPLSRRLFAHMALGFACLLLFACSSDDNPSIGGDAEYETSLPEHCDAPTDLFSVEELLENPEHACYDWIHAVYTRAAKGGTGGSAAIWSLDTERGNGLALSAAHVLKDFDVDESGDAPETLVTPDDETGLHFVRLSRPEAGIPPENYTATFPFYHPAISEEEMADGFANILPRHDFFLSAVDSQLAAERESFEAMCSAPPVLPFAQDTEIPDIFPADAEPGDLLAILGYPANGVFANQLAAVVVRVMTEAEIAKALAELRNVGDEEGGLSYDADAEMILEGRALPGMSGSGAFDREGRLAGLLVRGSTEEEASLFIVRTVRTPYIAGCIREAFEALDETQQEKIEPCLDPAILEL